MRTCLGGAAERRFHEPSIGSEWAHDPGLRKYLRPGVGVSETFSKWVGGGYDGGINSLPPQPESVAIPLESEGIYCPGCGYDLRGLGSGRCPECGLGIDAARNSIIPWERRGGLGYVRSFVSTLAMGEMQLAKATGTPIDWRSASLFRWIIRIVVIVPVVALFEFIVYQHGGLGTLFRINSPFRGAVGPWWEPQFLWVVGATFWPVLPIGFAVSVILATGVSQWFFVKRLEPLRRSRVMLLSFYLCSPLGWMLIPCLCCGAALVWSNPEWVGSSLDHSIVQTIGLVCTVSAIVLLAAMLNSVRAISAATHCGFIRSAVVAAGILVQAAAACAIGLGVFPAGAGLLWLMWSSLLR
jgi:hypothetical protein